MGLGFGFKFKFGSGFGLADPSPKPNLLREEEQLLGARAAVEEGEGRLLAPG